MHIGCEMAGKCLKCGETAKIQQLCKKCFLDSYSNIIGFKKFNLAVCMDCSSYCYGKQFRPAISQDKDLLKTIRKAFYENTKFKQKPEKFEIKVKIPKHTKKQGTKLYLKVRISVLTRIGEGKSALIKKEEFEFQLRFKYGICEKCNLGRSNYFEGRIQLRNDKNHSFEKAAEFIREKVKKAKNIFITKEMKTKNGIDFYATSQKYIQTVGAELSKRFGGELKITSSLQTMDWTTSKELYRVDVLFRLSEFNVGDIIKINKKLILAKSISGKMASGFDLKNNNKPAKENYTNKEYEIIATTKDYKEVNVVKSIEKKVKGKKELYIEVLSPEDYQTVKLENPKDIKKEKDLINVVIIDDKVYCVSF
jgi:NMD protein affecting ribosome stability and mRNA decay